MQADAVRNDDRYIYKLCGLVEDAFLRLKVWCSTTARYCERAVSFPASSQIRCLIL